MGGERERKRNFTLAISLVLVAAMFSFYLTPTGMQSADREEYTQPSLHGESGNYDCTMVRPCGVVSGSASGTCRSQSCTYHCVESGFGLHSIPGLNLFIEPFSEYYAGLCE
jgi:hypothetical protein